RLAVDIGGTFTDIALEIGDRIATSKTLTTPVRPVEGVMTGIGQALSAEGVAPGEVTSLIHGTTLATNALIERRGARVGVIATEGFRDILEIALERRFDQYDINLEKPDLIVPRDRVVTVAERVDVTGEVRQPLDEGSAVAAIDRLVALGVESIAVCLLHSYKTPAHERRLAELIAARAPDIEVSLSSEVSPEIREYDRLCTTIANAYIKPLMRGYLGRLAETLRGSGFDCPPFIVTSGGGITTLETAMAFPVRLVESGPSGGAILAAQVAQQRGAGDVLSFDMGGTTAKVCLIEGGRPKSSRSFEIGRAERFLKGSGLPARIPVIEMIEIGAGGGSIARIDSLGRLRVGPESASSTPGPACYGRGGTAPTVTDADVALGYIAPEGFAEGRLALEPGLAAEALATLGPEAARGISQMVDEAMANAARMHAVEQGKDLGRCAMVAFGGNGPLHASRVAEKVGIREIIIPPNPSTGSAVGFLFAPVAYEIVRSFYARVAAFPHAEIDALLAEMATEARRIVAAGAPGQPLEIRRVAFMRYTGQGHEIEVPLAEGPLDAQALADLVARFEADYARLYSRVVPGMEIEVMNWSVAISGPARAPARVADMDAESAPTPQGTRSLSLGGHVEARVFRREALRPGDLIAGPALITEPQTTSFVAPGFTARIDPAGNIVMRREGAGARTASEIDLHVMWDRLLAIVEEQGQALIRTAFSPIVRECGDISAGIFDLSGDMLAQAVTGTPGHINTMAEAVREMLPHFPVAEMAPGDVYTTNDPWIGSGHLNDFLMMAPIFHGGRPVAISACTSHVYDLGGLGMGPEGSDIYDEGLFVPPLKLVDRGEVSGPIMAMIKANSRSAVANEGDIYALIACCDVAAARLTEMMAEFELSDLEALASHILTTSRRATEAEIARLPRGSYRHRLMTDGYDFEIALEATLTISETGVHTDFTGSSGPSRFGINVPIKYAQAYAVYAMRTLIGREIPNNAGSLAP
ncbi:MAG: hydantoinase B/oxoprolinase family protein, partial [Pseudomonadota bacterium]